MIRPKLALLIIITVACFEHVTMQTVRNSNDGNPNVTLNAQLISSSDEEIRLKIVLTNCTSRIVYFATQPRDEEGNEGFYFSLSDENPDELEVNSRVYERPVPSPYANSTGVMLKRLDPKEAYEETIVLRFPLKETVPPRGRLKYHVENGKPVIDDGEISFPGQVKKDKIKAVKVTFGYFYGNPIIEAFLTARGIGPLAKGYELAEIEANGQKKTFLDIQNLVYTTITLKHD